MVSCTYLLYQNIASNGSSFCKKHIASPPGAKKKPYDLEFGYEIYLKDFASMVIDGDSQEFAEFVAR